jgi:hypothetical protein
MTKYALFAVTLLLLAAACGIGSSTETLGERPSEDLEKELLRRIIRYVGKLPPRATHETKFASRFDEYYTELAERHRIDLYYQDEASQQGYLLVSRIAPSLYVKRVATGIRLQLTGDSLAYYEEVFRTWKMPEEELAEKGGMLFTKMVKGEDLSPYYPQNSGQEEFIEFPDENTYYDAGKRVWVMKQPDVLEPYYELKE